MVVHILEPDDQIMSLNRMAASLGFAALSEEVRSFTKAEFEGLELGPEDIVVGGIYYARTAFARLGIAVPDLEPIPPALRGFAGRRLWQATMQELRRAVSQGRAIFAKPPPDRPKLFNGAVLSSVRDLIATAHLDDALVVDCAAPVAFLSEYRAFVLHGAILGLRHYHGDPLVFPDADVIRAALAAFKGAPAAYALDFGVTSDDRTLIVEINDAYACGAYGLTPIRYAKFIAARWEQLRQGTPTDPDLT